MVFKSTHSKLIRWKTNKNIKNASSEENIFVPLGKTPTSYEPDFALLEVDSLESEEIYTNDFLNYKVRLYAIKVVLNREILHHRQIPMKWPNEKSVLLDKQIVWRLNQIQLGTSLFSQNR